MPHVYIIICLYIKQWTFPDEDGAYSTYRLNFVAFAASSGKKYVSGESMERRTVDRRIAKTKRAIYSAFAELLSERSIDDITIKDIVDIADINRKTFYNYYSGIHMLLDEIENNIVRIYEEALGETDFREALNDPRTLFDKLTAIINTDLEFYGHLMSMKGNANLITKVVDLLKEKTRAAMITQIPALEKDADIILDFEFSGMLSVYRSWFLSENRPPIESVSETVSLLSFGGISAIMNDDFH